MKVFPFFVRVIFPDVVQLPRPAGAAHAGAVSRRVARSTLRTVRSDAFERFRESGDSLTFDGIDPCEPLTNRGRRVLSWSSCDWSSLSWEMLLAVEASIKGSEHSVPFEEMPPELAAYAGFVHLELCVRGDPIHGEDDGAILLPLLVAARKNIDPRSFRRYLLGWLERAQSIDRMVDSDGKHDLVRLAEFAVALGSASDSLIGDDVLAIRRRFEDEIATGATRFRDFVSPDERPDWCEVVSASTSDAREWAGRVMA